MKKYTFDQLVDMVAQNYDIAHDEAWTLTGNHLVHHISTLPPGERRDNAFKNPRPDDIVAVLNSIGAEHTKLNDPKYHLELLGDAARNVEHLSDLLDAATKKRNRHIIAALDCGARRIDVARQAHLSPQMIDNIKTKGVVVSDNQEGGNWVTQLDGKPLNT